MSAGHFVLTTHRRRRAKRPHSSTTRYVGMRDKEVAHCRFRRRIAPSRVGEVALLTGFGTIGTVPGHGSNLARVEVKKITERSVRLGIGGQYRRLAKIGRVELDHRPTGVQPRECSEKTMRHLHACPVLGGLAVEYCAQMSETRNRTLDGNSGRVVILAVTLQAHGERVQHRAWRDKSLRRIDFVSRDSRLMYPLRQFAVMECH